MLKLTEKIVIIILSLFIIACNNDDAGQKKLLESEEQRAFIESKLAELDLRAQLGQLLIVYLRWDENGKEIKSLGPSEREFLKLLQPGGVVLYAVNMRDPQQTLDLVNQIKEVLIIPPFIAVDEEGGRVSRLQRSAKMNASPVPSARRLGQSGIAAVGQAYSIIAAELAALGINMNFAPVADLGGMSASDIIGDRAFSDDILLNAQMVASAVEALKAQKVIPIVKHFPGHGRSSGDSHFGVQRVNVELEELSKTDLLPFIQAFKHGATGIMTAHISYPQIDPSKLPASMSSVLLNDLLRQQLQFEGLVITDALDMHGILGITSAQEAAVASLIAGCDILLGPQMPLEVVDEIQKALLDGRLSQTKINEILKRILTVKKEFGFFDMNEHDITKVNPSEILGSKKHLDLLKHALESKQLRQ